LDNKVTDIIDARCNHEGDTPFLTSEILSLRVCNSAERARNSLLLKLTLKEKSKANKSVNGLAKKCHHKLRYFWQSFYGRMHGGKPTSDPCFYYMASSAESTVNIVSFFFYCCLSVLVDNHTIIIPTKRTSFLLLKAQIVISCAFNNKKLVHFVGIIIV
jgi:hypothetical protein